jgi:hypothetical protein
VNEYIWGCGCNNLHERKNNAPYHLQIDTMIHVVSFIVHDKEYFGWKIGTLHQHVKNVPNDINKFTLLLFHKFVMISSIVPYDVPIILCSYIPNECAKSCKWFHTTSCSSKISILFKYYYLHNFLYQILYSHMKKWNENIKTKEP